jgi:thioredoxin-related protein
MKIAAFFALLIFLPATLVGGEIKFIKEDWAGARKLAEAQKKILLVDFYTDWCGWCDEMDKTTFKDSAICAFINEYFIPLHLNAEKGIGITAAMKYRVSAFPTFGFYSPDGHMITKSLGYQKPEGYRTTLENVVELERKGSYYKGVSPTLEIEYPDFYRIAYGQNGERKYPDSIVVVKYLAQQTDLFSEPNFSIICRFTTSPTTDQFFLDNREKYTELYGREDVEQKVYSIIYDKVQLSIRAKDTSLLGSAFSMIDRYTLEKRDENKSWYRSMYYKGIGDWKLYAGVIDEGLKKGQMDDDALNQASWTIYEKSEEPGSIQMALHWMERVVTTTPSYAFLDTFASLLMKDRQYQRAEEYALKAIQTGKANNENVKPTEKLLDKIRENLQKK